MLRKLLLAALVAAPLAEPLVELPGQCLGRLGLVFFFSKFRSSSLFLCLCTSAGTGPVPVWASVEV